MVFEADKFFMWKMGIIVPHRIRIRIRIREHFLLRLLG